MRPALLSAALLLSACASGGPPRTPAPVPAPEHPAIPAPATHDPHLHAAPPQAPALPSPVVVPIDPASLAALPRATVIATAHGATLHCTGVALAAVLQAAGVIPADGLRGAALGRYVQVDARDGYRALFALAEFDPTLGNSTAALVDRCDGKLLDEDDGPLRLLVPGEARPARWVRQVQAITVIVAP
ncbi:MAG: molybdopterin-dependent oxidoreductase [Luteimonas sp.]|nr:molybdopterin-dependent oxidoreductase [Luteimonas sp.]